MCRKVLFLLVILLFIPIFSSQVQALTYGNLEVHLIKNANDVPAIIREEYPNIFYTPSCLAECDMPLLFKWTGSDFTLQKSDLKYYKQQILGIDNLIKIELEYLKNETYIIQEWIPNIICNDIWENETWNEVCSDNGYYISVEKWRLFFIDVPSTIPIQSGKWYIINLKGYKKASLGYSGLDLVPEIKGILLSAFAWWDSDWPYKKPITIETATTVTEYQMGINVTNLTNIQSDCDDVRFTNSAENVELKYYLETKVDGSWCYFWVRGNWSNANGTQAYMYYGNSTVSTTSNGKLTFNLFDDFDDDSINTTIWVASVGTGGSITESGGIVNVTSGSAASWCDLGSIDTFGANFCAVGNVSEGQFEPNTGWGFQGQNLSGVLNMFEWGYPTAGNINSRNYNGTSAGYAWGTQTGWQRLMVCRNGSTSADYSVNYSAFNSLTAGYSPTSRSTRMSILNVNKWIASDWWFVKNYSYPEPTYSFGSEEYPSAISTWIRMYLNGTEGNVNYNYGNSTNVTATINVTGLWVAIERNGTLLYNNTSRSTNVTLWGVGYWNFTAYYTGNTTYSSNKTTYYVNITKTSTTISLAINGTEDDVTYTYPNGTNVTGWKTVSNGNLSLYQNGTIVNSTTTANSISNVSQFSPGVYNWTLVLDHSNYTASSVTRILTISKKASNLTLTADPSWNIQVNTQINISCTAIAALNVTLSKDGVNVSNPYVAVLPNGLYNFTCIINDTANYTPSSASNYLNVIVSGIGCTNNTTFTYISDINTTGITNVTLNFTTLVNQKLVRSDLNDVWLSAPSNTTIGKEITDQYYILIYPNGSNNVTLYFGNYYANYSITNMTKVNSTITDFSYSQSSPYYYIINFIDEMTGNLLIPPNTTQTYLQLYCSGGTGIVNITENTSTQITIATYAQLSQMEFVVQYSATEIYYRDLLISNPIEYKNMYVVDANTNQVVQILIQLQDNSLQFTSPVLHITKLIGEQTATITERAFDSEKKAIVYLINGQQYAITVTSGSLSRTIGNLYVDTVNLIKTIVVGAIITTNTSYGNTSYTLSYNNTTGVISFAWYDPGENTLFTEFWVYNYTNQSQLFFYSNSSNTSNVGFTYTVPDVNETYWVKGRIPRQCCCYHSRIGGIIFGLFWIISHFNRIHRDCFGIGSIK